MKLYQEETIAITDVIVTKRDRDLGDLTSLKAAIEKVGLLQPIVVTTDNVLCAGERRLTSCRELGWSEIPVRRCPAGTTADDQLVIELFENIERKEFLWHEEIALTLRLHELWEAENPDEWSAKKTATRLGCSPGGLSTNLELAKAIKSFPILRDLPTKAKAREAYKKIKQDVSAILTMQAMSPEDQERIKQMASASTSVADSIEDVTTSGECTPMVVPKAMHDDNAPNVASRERSIGEAPEEAPAIVVPKAIYKITTWDKLLADVPDTSVGMVDLDPPYAIDFENTYGKTTNIKSQNTDWTVGELKDFYSRCLPILHDKMIDDSWGIIWSAKEHAWWTLDLLTKAGFKTQPPGVWVKPSGSCNSPKTNMTSCYETFLLFRKGKATFNSPSMPNVLSFDPSPSGNRIHQWEKPMGLCNYLLRTLGRRGTIYLSLFAGSGNAMVAAALADMIPMGCDIQDKFLHLFYEHLQSYYN